MVLARLGRQLHLLRSTIRTILFPMANSLVEFRSKHQTPRRPGIMFHSTLRPKPLLIARYS